MKKNGNACLLFLKETGKSTKELFEQIGSGKLLWKYDLNPDREEQTYDKSIFQGKVRPIQKKVRDQAYGILSVIISSLPASMISNPCPAMVAIR